MKKLLFIICVFSLFFVSCDLLLDLLLSDEESKNSNNTENSEEPVDPNFGNFWSRSFKTGKQYRVDADLLVEGKHCNVWVEKGSATKAQAQQVANEYDNKIYGMMIENFSITNFTYNANSFPNIMDFADWLADEDGKLCILLLDIKDNYKKDVNDSYIAGYFHPLHFFNDSTSNRRDMIFIDTKPGMNDTKEAFSTLAHEMQHLMNFTTAWVLRSTQNQSGQLTGLNIMDTWVDEGLASAAEYLYSGHLINRINWFVYNGFKESSKQEHRGLINRGNNFFVWGNRENENQYANQDDYSTVYIFFQWLRLQAGRSTIYREIISSLNYDYRAVTGVMNSAVPGNGFSDWNVLLKTWHAANYINASSGIYGYKNDLVLKDLKVPSSSSISSSISLVQGEGVYSRMGASFSMPSSSANIKYASLSKNPVSVDNVAANGRILLTYNANTALQTNSNNNYIAIPETGITTGLPIPASVNTASENRSIMPETIGPYRIDAGDFLRREPITMEQMTKIRE